MTVKFISVEKFIKQNETEQASGFDLIQKLKDAPAEDVIPVGFIDNWFEKNYKMHLNPIARDWKDETC